MKQTKKMKSKRWLKKSQGRGDTQTGTGHHRNGWKTTSAARKKRRKEREEVYIVYVLVCQRVKKDCNQYIC